MSDVMPIEQAEFIDNLQRWFSESTNMCHEDCYRLAFIVWQHKDYLSKVLGADERAKCKCPYWNEEHQECATSFEEDIRADERQKVLLEIIHKGSVPAWFEEEVRKDERAKIIDLIDRHLWNYSQEVWEDFKPILEQLKEQKTH